LIMCGLTLIIFTGCERELDPEIIKSEPGTLDPIIVSANTQFGFNLFNEIRKNEQDKNIFVSPYSVSVALAMTLNGASGETEQAMVNTLQLQGLGSDLINSGYFILNQTLQSTDPKVTLTIANSLWGKQGIPFKQDFLDRNSQYFNAEITTLDFSDPSASQTINMWVDTSTNGKIQKIVDDNIDPQMVLFLINAIYFKGSWQTKFDSENTRDATFHLESGSTKQVPMMNRTDNYMHYVNHEDGLQAISLPYGDGQMSMYIFLPSRESDLDTFLDGLNAENWENWMSQFQERKIWVQIPKFSLEYETSLIDTLTSLGMSIAFDEGRANFSRMASLEDIVGNLYIAKVKHKAFIDVNEEGSEAAAVTGIGIAVTSLPPQFIADRPFFFAIRDNKTKTVLFMGTVVDP
ncbi:serpin family protein, partial [Candidatus Poribacteria bacterium]|nr:serpin family protein [Candidatus Poribacteria bacterium]